MDLFLKAKIKKIIPSAVYEGKVYTQYVFLEIDGGAVIDVFDDGLLVKSENINKTNIFLISTFLNEVNLIDSEKFDVIPSKSKNNHSGGHIFFGKIIGSSERGLVLDFGKGKIHFDSDGKNNFKIGDFIKLESNRTDLSKILGV